MFTGQQLLQYQQDKEELSQAKCHQCRSKIELDIRKFKVNYALQSFVCA